jgi:anti-anti-sigma factor
MEHRNEPDFEVETVREGGRLTVAPAGELDLATVPDVESALRDGDPPPEQVVLDLSAVTFMDTSGLRLVLEEDKRAAARGGGFSIIPGPPSVQRIFELSGVADRLPFAPADDSS